MDVKSHINFLLKEYKLEPLYYKFVTFSLMTTLIKESFYWVLIYFTIKLESKQHIQKAAGILLSILLLTIPLDNLACSYKIELLRKLKDANNSYFINKLNNTSKKDLLGIDLVYFFNTLQILNIHIQEYILNTKILGEIPITFISVLIIVLSKNLGKSHKGKILIVILFIIFFMLLIYLNEQEIKKEIVIVEDTLKFENFSRDYLVNSKTYLINNNFNNNYMMKNVEIYNKLNSTIEKMDNMHNSHTNLSMFVVFSIIISYFIDNISPSNILRYFLIIYDIDTVTKKVREFYKNKMSYDKMGVKLKIMQDMVNNDNLIVNQSSTQIDKITVSELTNSKPPLQLQKPIILKKGEHKLISGVSGSGKTTLMYLLKGVKSVDHSIVEPPLEQIHSRCYITLPNSRDLFSANLYDILTNFESKPNIELIKEVLKIANLEKYLEKPNPNEYINIETLSAGEFTRVMIARLIYQIKSKDCYDVLLFDEIDTNLNNDLSIEICKTLRNIFNDKIILYITHNDEVKKLFSEVIYVKNGKIN